MTDTVQARPTSPLEATIGAGQAIVPAAVVGGWIYSQYVEVHIFSWLVPALIGVAGASGAMVRRKAGPPSRPMIVGVMAGLLGTAFGFRLFPHGPHDPLHPWHEVGLPYAAAFVAAVVWPFVLGPPRKPDPSRAVIP